MSNLSGTSSVPDVARQASGHPSMSTPAPRLVTDSLTNRSVFVAEGRARRPNIGSAAGCPFCPGGGELPDPYDTAWFPNRWPPIDGNACEVLVHTPRHDVDLGCMHPHQARLVVDSWASRSSALLERPDIEAALVFENRGPEAGATVAHAHSQLFGFSGRVPLPMPPSGECAACRVWPEELVIVRSGDWRMVVPQAPPSPYSLMLIPDRHITALEQASDDSRNALAAALCDAVRRLDGVFDRRMPYQLWFFQRLPDRSGAAHLVVTLAGLLRTADTVRVLGAAELATGLLFVPVAPTEAAAALRRPVDHGGR